MLYSSRGSVNNNAYWYFFLSLEFERQSNYRVRKDGYLQKPTVHGLILWRNPRNAARFAGSGALGYKHLRQCFICHAQSWGNKNNQKLTVFKSTIKSEKKIKNSFPNISVSWIAKGSDKIKTWNPQKKCNSFKSLCSLKPPLLLFTNYVISYVPNIQV